MRFSGGFVSFAVFILLIMLLGVGCSKMDTQDPSVQLSIVQDQDVDSNADSTGPYNVDGLVNLDPGSSVPLWKPNANTYVFNRGISTDLFVPRCVPNEYQNCRYGSMSKYDTINAGEVWAMRIPFRQDLDLRLYIFGVARAETGESLNAYDIAISNTPGEFDVSQDCRQTPGYAIAVYDAELGPLPKYSSACPLKRNTMYYLNIRPSAGSPGGTLCGTSAANACRLRILPPNAL